MGEFDENFEDETVDTSSEGSYDTSDSDDFDESSSDSFDEDVSNAEYEEQQAEAEAEANAEYAEQQAEAEAKANAEYEEDQIDESELSPAELYELGQQEAKEAQDKAERWADENNLDSWYDGTPRANYHEDVEDSPEMAMDANADQQEEAQSQKEYEEQQAEAERQQEYKEQQAEAEARQQAEYEAEQQAEAQRQAAEYEADQRTALEADVKAQAEALNKEYIELMDRKQAASDSTVDATNVEDRERFADLQRDLGEEMENVRSRMIDNNNRLK